MVGAQGKAAPETLKARAGLKAFQPLTPKEVRDAAHDLISGGAKPLAAGAELRKRYRAGEWRAMIQAGEFGHMRAWSIMDWASLVRSIAFAMHQAERRGKGTGGRKPRVYEDADFGGGDITRDAQKRLLDAVVAAESNAARVRAEAKARGAIEAVSAEDEESDAKKHLDQLRKAIMSKMTIDEQAELLVSTAREGKAAGRSAMSHILDLMGVKAANTPEAPGQGPIFALPEGSGPALR